jgi:hypothetical protein
MDLIAKRDRYFEDNQKSETIDVWAYNLVTITKHLMF